MLTGLHTTYNRGSYEQDRDYTIKVSEDRGLLIGTDLSALNPKVGVADGHLVIGYGYDLLENDVFIFQQDLLAIGIDLSPAQDATLQSTILDYQAGFISANSAASALSFINLQDETTAASLLTRVVDRFESEVDDRLLQFGQTLIHSQERAALVSMAYNGGTWDSSTKKGLLGPGLMDALVKDDRAEAWYQIRYQSNGGNSRSDGIAKRRYYESHLFGLYDEGVTASNITDTQAREVYEMYTDHRTTILSYENEFSAKIPSANTDFSTGLNPVDTLEESLINAGSYLLQEYANQPTWDVIDLLDIQVANDTGQTLTGTERNGYLITSGNNANQRNDLLIGGDGIDYLYGLGGDDILVGGLNDDNLFGSSGRDEMYGEGGDDLLVGDDDTVQDQLEGGSGQDTYLVNNNDSVIDSDLDGLVTVHGPRVNINNIQVAEGSSSTLQLTLPTVAVASTTQTEEGFFDALGNFLGELGSFFVQDAQAAESELLQYQLTVSDPDRVTLSGNNIAVIDAVNGLYSVTVPSGTNNINVSVQTIAETNQNDTGDNAVKVDVSYLPYGNTQDFVQNDTRINTGVIQITDTTETRTYAADIIKLDVPVQYIVSGYVDFPEYIGGPSRWLSNGYNIVLDNRGNAYNDSVNSILIPEYIDGAQYWLPASWGVEVQNVRISDIYNNFFLPEDDPNYLPLPTVGNVPYEAGYYGDTLGGYFPVYGNATVYTREGVDVISTSFGDDQVYSGAGNDVVYTGPGVDIIYGEDGNDVIGSESGDDIIYGGRGNDLISGGQGGDVIFGGDGDDFLDGETVNISFIKPEWNTESILFDEKLIYGAYSPLNIIIPGDYSYQLVEQQRPFAANAITGMNINLPVALEAGHNFLITEQDALFPINEDTVAYYLGDDYIDGGKGNDFILGWGGNDNLFGGDDNDTVNGGTGDDLIDGGNGHDWLTGWRGSDTIYGGDGHDALLGNYGDDYLYGEAGHDVLYGDGVVETFAGSGIYIEDPLQNGNDYLNGGSGEDDLLGGYGNDIVEGGADNDNLWGGEGADVLNGDAGDDNLFGENGNDYLLGGSGQDSLLGGDGNDLLYGDAGNDTLEGGLGDDVLNGGSGNNSLWGDEGNDSLYGGEWNEYLNGGDNNDSLYGNGGVDTLEGGLGNDFLYGGDMGDSLTGNQGTDYLFGEQGNDILNGGSEIDYLYGGEGNDTLNGGSGNDELYGGAGGDLLTGSTGADYLYGGDGSDRLYGTTGNNHLYGGNGNDGLYGGNGIETLNGGAGNDLLYGYGGSDTYEFDSNSGKDIIFSAGRTSSIIINYTSADTLSSDVALYQQGLDLFLTSATGNQWIKVEGYYDDANSTITNAPGIAQIQFSDGVIWDANSIQANVISGTVNDQVYSGQQSQLISVDHVSDTVTVTDNLAVETIQSSVDFDLSTTVNVENLVLTGTLNLNATGNSLNNILTGNSGDNKFVGGGGSDTFIGGLGDDKYWYGNNIVELAGEGVDTLYRIHGFSTTSLADNVENLSTVSGSSRTRVTTYRGNDLDNIIDIRDGNGVTGEILDGGAGVDTMYGSIQDNIFIVDNANDIVVETGFGYDIVQSSAISYQLTNGVEELVLTGNQAINGSGNSLNNILNGLVNTATNTLAGGSGDDVYVIGDNDTVVEIVDEGIDIVELRGRGNATYLIDNYTFANVEGLRLGAGTTGNLVGNALDNNLYGEDGLNILTGGAGNDHLEGGRGDDTYVFNLGDGQDTVLETNGNDTIQFGSGIALTQLDYSLRNNNLTINILATGDSITIDNWLDGGGRSVENLRFDNNDVINLASQVNTVNILDGTENIDALRGYIDSVDHVMYGYAGSDTLDGYRTTGADILYGGMDDDVYRIDALDTVIENAGEGVDEIILQNFTTINYSLENNPNVENLRLNGSQSGSLTGNALDNSIYAGSGLNTLTGLQGNDYLEGGRGADTYVFNIGDGQDTILDYDSNTTNLDTILFGAGISFADLNIRGENGNLIISIINTADQITINNWFSSNANRVEQIIFNDGQIASIAQNTYIDSVVITGSGNIQGAATNDELIGSNAVDFIYGFAGNDNLYGGAGDDQLYGYGGDDYLDGGEGADKLEGAAGDDIYIIDNVGDKIFFENSVNGTDLIFSSIDYSLDTYVENLTLTGSANLNATGNQFNNIINGNTGSNTLEGGLGNDSLSGGAGSDRYIFGADTGIDQITDTDATAGNIDVIYFNNTVSSANVVWVQNENDLVISVTGGTTQLTLSNFFSGRENLIEQIIFDSGETWNLADITNAYSANASLSHDLLQGNEFNNIINGLQGQDEIYGRMGDDLLNGNEGNDYLAGNAGEDILNGGTGDDTLLGGADNDTYVIDSAQDTVIENLNEGEDIVYSNIDYTLGSNIENLTLLGVNNFDAIGNDLNNLIQGNDGDNQVIGRLGNDVLLGGQGNDTLIAGTGTLGGQEFLYGEQGNDWLYGSDVSSFMYGGDGQDILNAGAGFTEAYGGNGNDTLYASDIGSILYGDDLLNAETGDDQLLGADGVDNLYGGNGDDLLNGYFGNDYLNGGNGIDQLDGGLGADQMIGGSGDDTYIVNELGDTVTELLNEGTDSVLSFISYTLGDNVENLTLTGTAILQGTGNVLDNIIYGNTAANIINAGAGNDSINSGAGNDTVHGDAGDDHLTSTGSGTNNLYGDDGRDTITGALGVGLTGIEWLYGGLGNDTLTSGDKFSIVFGGEGGDTINGGAGENYLLGELGNDVLTAGSGTLHMSGGDGDDLLNGSINNERLLGDAGNDIINGGAGIDIINTGAGNDTVHGDDGDDQITSTGSGSNNLYGDDGNDTISGALGIGLTGTEWLHGGLGNDLLTTGDKFSIAFGGEGSDIINGGAGNNYLLGELGNDVLTAGSGTLHLSGGDGDDVLNGGLNSERLFGDSGNDTINGNGGDDTINGGFGDDQFLFNSGDGNDLLTDASGNDQIVFGNLISANQLWFEQNGSSLDISVIGQQDSISITNWYNSDLDHIETFQVDNGSTLSHTQVDQMVSAMASFGVTDPSQFTPTVDQQIQIDQLVAVNWQAV